MGPCAFRDRPQGNIIEINDDIVTRQAQELTQKRAYQVQTQASSEEVLVSLAANMQAMSQNIRSKNAFHLNKLQKIKKSKAFGGFVAMVKKKLPTSSIPEPRSSSELQ